MLLYLIVGLLLLKPFISYVVLLSVTVYVHVYVESNSSRLSPDRN